MYLSRLLLSGEHLLNPYEIHRSLWTAFPDVPDQNRDFLFRVEQRSSREVRILMQSQRRPKLETDNLRLLASKTFELNLIDGLQLRFLLIANPVKTITDEQGRTNRIGEVKKCRVPLIQEEEQVAWLKRKLDSVALIHRIEVEKQIPLHFRRHGKLGKIQPYVFKGGLQVENGAELGGLIQNGIGPAKAFGCGLLSLAKW